MADEYVVGTEELLAKFKALGEATQGESLATAARAGGTVVLNATKGNVAKQGLIKIRTLSRSLHMELVEQTPTQAAVEVGTDLEYGAIHEFGGVIKPRTAKYLAIPVGSRKGSPSSHGDLKLRKTRGGNLVMVDEGGEVQYVLKKSVEIPPRPYLRPAADENQAEVAQEMGAVFKQVVEEAAK